MAGGGQVQVVGHNQRVKEGITNVTNHELWVRLASSGIVLNVSDIPVRSQTNLFTAEVIDGTPLTADSPTVDVSAARWALILFAISVAGAPTDITLIPQFSNDGGTTWFDYRVDQWVDMRFVPAQMSLSECIPLNYVMGSSFRLHVVTTGTGVGVTFTIDADIQICN